jgi:hypothetical protein
VEEAEGEEDQEGREGEGYEVACVRSAALPTRGGEGREAYPFPPVFRGGIGSSLGWAGPGHLGTLLGLDYTRPLFEPIRMICDNKLSARQHLTKVQ